MVQYTPFLRISESNYKILHSHLHSQINDVLTINNYISYIFKWIPFTFYNFDTHFLKIRQIWWTNERRSSQERIIVFTLFALCCMNTMDFNSGRSISKDSVNNTHQMDCFDFVEGFSSKRNQTQFREVRKIQHCCSNKTHVSETKRFQFCQSY